MTKSSSNYGLVLLPSVKHMQEVINFRQAAGSSIGGPVLTLDTCLPHVSILQCPFNPEALTSSTLESIIESFMSGREETSFKWEATLGELYYEPIGWMFSKILFDTWGKRLQKVSLEGLESHIEASNINLNKDFSSYSEAELICYKKYGYRNVGDLFRPHITVGRAASEVDFISMKLNSIYNSQLEGRSIVFTRLAFCTLGSFGTVSGIISDVELSPLSI